MSLWDERILKEFPADLSRLWIAADPDDVLLDERVLAGLRERGFELLPFVDSVVFRAEYEQRYRQAWEQGQDGPAKALVLHLRSSNINDLPWDYLKEARRVSLSLANLFPKLNYPVVRAIGAEYHEALFAAQSKHASQMLGGDATKEFVLMHIFKVSPHLISRPEELWNVLLKLHYRDAGLPTVLADHVAHVLDDNPVFSGLPISDLFSSKSTLLRTVQAAWYRYLKRLGVTGSRTGEPETTGYVSKADVPFEHPDVRVIIDSMFLDGLLHPLAVQGIPTNIPEWAKTGVIQDPLALRKLVEESISGIHQSLATIESHRDWSNLSRKLGEVIARFHTLDSARAEGLKAPIAQLQSAADERLLAWAKKHYADLPSLPAVKAPVMVHRIPDFLAMRRGAGEAKIALLIFDGMAVDQWVQIRESLAQRAPHLGFDENTCFAWLPTLTSVSRQAIFSGRRPREFAASIESTSSEPTQWSRFWQDEGLKANEVLYRKSIKISDQLPDLEAALSAPQIKVAGIVIDTIDEIVHGAVLGKRGVANQIESWCDTGFIEQLFNLLLSKGFSVYLTADHGNVDATGQGKPNQGVASEMRSERVRTYRVEEAITQASASNTNTFRFDIAGLPADFMTLYAGGRTAFMQQGAQAVVHGGISVEELIVPFVKVMEVSKTE
jgi:hypothetical protein